MNNKRRTTAQHKPLRWYRGANVPMAVIRRFARDVVKHFRPDKIILFGSHAHGRPHADSDVDILVIMPARNELDQAFKIHSTLLPPFPLDIIVRTPKEMQWRLEEGESFTMEIVMKGNVLYEKSDPAVGAKGRIRLQPGRKARSRKERALPR
ncbi:MAG: nucleotidyltransferase domain-containing protein [Gemmataceae bacterium]|nr:nucleotidyltransferase domain-containing protein [Gemmataceae bacterium]